MRELTFKGFLAAYVKELSNANTVDLAVLAREAATENHRLKAPLILYAVTHNKSAALRSRLMENASSNDLLNMLAFLETPSIEELLESGSLPEEYCKVWNSFKVRRDRPQHEGELKAAMRNKILQMQKAKGCSNYRLYKDLNLNPGNVNSWLKNGDGTKVSYRTAERIIAYVTRY